MSASQCAGLPPPITSGLFTYSSQTGFVVNKHRRCPATHLYDLLTHIEEGPRFKKNGQLHAHQSAPHKDQTAGFYEAQLVHYGLKPLKTKAAAKHALLAAFKGDKKGLKVPPEFVKLEKEMAVLYEKKRKLLVEEMALGTTRNTGAAKKRKNGEDIGSTDKQKKVKSEQNALKIKSEHTAPKIKSEPTAPKAKAQSKPANPMAPGKKVAIGPKKPNEASKGASPKKVAASKKTSSNVTTRPLLQTARKQAIRLQDYSPPREAPEGLDHSPARPLQTARKPSVSQDHEQRSFVSGFQGVWIIEAPAISSGWPDECASGLYMSLEFSTTTRHLWGHLDFGIYEGYLRSCGPVENKAGITMSFLWRGRETGEGESTYDASNRGSLTLKPRGLLDGEISTDIVGNVTLSGRKVHAVRGTGIRSGVSVWKNKFWELNEANYQRESVSRWGGSMWGYSYDSEREENSDTTNLDTDGEGYGWDDDEGSGPW